MLLKINGSSVLGIGEMHWIAMRWIFDRLSVRTDERVALEESIGWWSKQELHKSTKWELRRIVNALLADEKGFFDRSKELQIQHKVDYRTMYKAGLPFVNIEGRTSFSKP